jgi:hypothetical protein
MYSNQEPWFYLCHRDSVPQTAPDGACATQWTLYRSVAETVDDLTSPLGKIHHHGRFLALQNVSLDSTFCETLPLGPPLKNEDPYRRTRSFLGPVLKPSNLQAKLSDGQNP